MTTRVLVFCSDIVVFLSAVLVIAPVISDAGQSDLRSSSFSDKQRVPALFAHDEHNEKADIEACSVCHHLYQFGEKVEDASSEDMRCSDCHHVKRGSPARPLMKAYHDLCKTCHQQNRVGPITCGECHTPG